MFGERWRIATSPIVALHQLRDPNVQQKEPEELAQQATCTEPVTLTLECKDGCGAKKDVTIPPAGHQTGTEHVPFGAEGHRVKCTRCGQLVGDLLPHSWVYASHELYCPTCYYTHSEGCTG